MSLNLPSRRRISSHKPALAVSPRWGVLVRPHHAPPSVKESFPRAPLLIARIVTNHVTRASGSLLSTVGTADSRPSLSKVNE